jgi:hypothetical protein
MRAVRRVGMAVAVAGALLAGAPPVLAAPIVSLDPATVPTSGQLITVQVSGCPPGQSIAVASTAARRTFTVNADGSGNATTSVASSGTAGTFTVSATCGGETASARFTVVAPPARAEPGAGAIGPRVTLIGIGGAAALVVLAAGVLLVRRRRALVGTII